MVEKVGYTKPVTSAKALRKAAKAGSAGFADALSNAEASLASEETSATREASAVCGVNPFLGLQEVDGAEYERGKAVKQGRLTLEVLSQLRDALLMGSLPVSTIERLERLVSTERAVTTDPVLSSILDEIELRAAVEMAKLEVALANR